MSIMKFEDRTPRSIEQMVEYMKDEKKTDDGNGSKTESVFGIGVNPDAVVEEMQFVQDVYCKEDLAHPYVQVILSFGRDIDLPPSIIREICMEIGQRLLTDERQVYGAIHCQGTMNIHCHYMINYVGIDGTLYQQKHHVNHYKRLANEVLEKHGLNPIKLSRNPVELPFRICI